MQTISLFAGAGGMDGGADQAGLKDVDAYEFDAAACEVYERFLNRPIHQCDLTKHDLGRLPKADFIIGGPPCQDFSSGGKRRGKDGDRNLWPIAMKAVETVRPAMFVFENVRGLLQGPSKAYFDEILTTFRGMGYKTEWMLLEAANYGVPQTRERVFIVGRRDGHPICWPMYTHWNAPQGLFFQRWISWGDALAEWMTTAEISTKPMPKWLLKLPSYANGLPENGLFDGHQKGSGKTRQHRPINEPAFTLVKSNSKSLVRVKVGETIYRLDERGSAILQTFPYVPGLTIAQIGNSVPPLMAKTLFSSLLAA